MPTEIHERMIDPISSLQLPTLAMTRSYRRKRPMCFQDNSTDSRYDDISELSWDLDIGVPIIVLRIHIKGDMDRPQIDGDNIYEIIDPSGRYATLAGRYIDHLAKS